MKIKPEFKRTAIIATLALSGFCAFVAAADPFAEDINLNTKSGGQGSQCPGPFLASTSLTNSSGGLWIIPPAGETNAILTDITPNVPTNYGSVVSSMRKSDLMTWCSDTTVSFPVSSGDSFQLKLYVISGVPTNGPEILQVTWQP